MVYFSIIQGKEPPAFLNLFRGKMVVYNGKRWDTNVEDIAPPSPSVPTPSPNKNLFRLFLVRYKQVSLPLIRACCMLF